MTSIVDRSVADLLSGLDDAQRRCVVAEAPTVVIEAGAGAGKTRVLTRRVAFRARTGSADPEKTMVLTFTRKAAAELTSRLVALGVDGVSCSTIHAAARNLLDRYWADRGAAPRALTRNPERLLAEALGRSREAHLPAVARELAWARPRGVDATTYEDAARAHRRSVDLPLDHVAQAFARYDHYKRRRGVMDLGDLLPLCSEALADPVFAEAVRWRVRHIAVDEAQDLDRTQWRLVRQLLGPGDDLCLVGDPQQTIYQWNGADPRFLGELERAFPQLQRFRLQTNYRSGAAIVSLAGSLADRHVPVEVASEHPGAVEVVHYVNDQVEARQVVRWARRARAAGTGWSQLAVLARTRALLAPIEQQLRAVGIPVRSGRALLDEPVVRQALEALGQVGRAQPARATAVDLAEIAEEILDEVARLGSAEPRGKSLAGAPGGGVGDRERRAERTGPGTGLGDGDPSRERRAERARTGDLKPQESAGRPGDGHVCRCGHDACDDDGGGVWGDHTDAWGDDDLRRPSSDAAVAWASQRLGQLMALVDEWVATQPHARAEHLRDWLYSTLRTRGGEPGDPISGVELATFHRAKGLEFDHVYLVGLEDGTVPLAHSGYPDEERRLLYVAATRARRSLTCSWVTQRSVDGSRRRREPSPWLAEIQAVARAAEQAGAGGALRGVDQVALLRARLTG